MSLSRHGMPGEYYINLTNPELIRVIDHILHNWDQQTIVTGTTYGPAELVAEEGFVTPIVDGLYADLARKTRGRMVLEVDVQWFYDPSERVTLTPVNVETDLSGFREVPRTADVQAVARAAHHSIFAVRVRAVTLPAIPRHQPYDVQSQLLNHMMETVARRFAASIRSDLESRRNRWIALDTDRPRNLDSLSLGLEPLPQVGYCVTPEQIRTALSTVDSQPPPTIPEEPYTDSMQVDSDSGPYPLDFDALVSQIDELTEGVEE